MVVSTHVNGYMADESGVVRQPDVARLGRRLLHGGGGAQGRSGRGGIGIDDEGAGHVDAHGAGVDDCGVNFFG